ncbi:MAG: MFS transporter [Candidatus Promineifilaceae bacterium]
MAFGKAIYFLYYGGLACVIPFLTLYYSDLGLSGRQIGVLTGLVPLIGTLSSPIWGMAADASGRHRITFLLALGGTWTSVLLIMRAGSFLALVPAVILYAVCSAPNMPLVDDAVVAFLGEERRGEYGRVRVWGSYGWGLAAALIGVAIAASGLQAGFYGFLVIFLVLIPIASRLPMNLSERSANFFGELRVLLKNSSWLLFIAVSMVIGASIGIFLNYLFPYLESLGTSAQTMGLTLTLATISEIPIFIFSRQLLNRWSAPFLLTLALVGTVLRSLAYGLMTAPWQVLPISLLHGPTFALMWIAGVSYSAAVAPPGLGATAQAVFSGLTMGLGAALGSLAGGFIYEAYGPVSLYYSIALVTVVATVVFILANRKSVAAGLVRQRS